ncbi:MAG: glycosyl transferase [Microbacteriaceae bacterium]|nr:glycosyl transferase [Microbacteriaceae bacterium]
MKPRSVLVIVPARDEAALVGRCLTALETARDRAITAHPGLAVRTIVVADRCLDGTASIARGFEGVEVVEIDAATVGTARQAGADYALSTESPRRAWLANTDADSEVPAGWILDQVTLAAGGADVVVGTVRPRFSDLSAAEARDWTATHVSGRPNGHVHGANLGVRASAYAAVGGFQQLSEHEDVDLVGRLVGAGFRIAASDRGEVLTSGRRVGRTPGGYAAYLARGH